jgi:hypothetical protein
MYQSDTLRLLQVVQRCSDGRKPEVAVDAVDLAGLEKLHA